MATGYYEGEHGGGGGGGYANVDIATYDTPGIVMPDGETMLVQADGTLSMATLSDGDIFEITDFDGVTYYDADGVTY